MNRRAIAAFKQDYPLLWRKIDILCHGLKTDSCGLVHHYYCCQNPHETQRTGNAGLQLKLGKERLALNVAVFKKFSELSPYTLEKSIDGKLHVVDSRDGSQTEAFCPEIAPKWYSQKVTDGKTEREIGHYVLLEGDSTAIASITKGCVYFNLNDPLAPCAFCAIGPTGKTSEENKSWSDMLLEALPIVAEDPTITNFHLTGGNTMETDRGASNYFQFVRAILDRREDAMIAVEIPPPEPRVQKAIFAKLRDIGVDSITINIEFWDDKIRSELMPIKGAISKSDYLAAYQNALDIFGKNKVTCGFIVGVENINSTKAGIKHMASMGVVTEVYPFKPNTGSRMEDYPITATEDILEASFFANSLIQKYNIYPNLSSGCVKCGACGLTQQLIKI